MWTNIDNRHRFILIAWTWLLFILSKLLTFCQNVFVYTLIENLEIITKNALELLDETLFLDIDSLQVDIVLRWKFT